MTDRARSSSSVTDARTLSGLLESLVDVEDRGLYFDDQFVSWRAHLASSAQRVQALSGLFDSSRPPHVGVLLGNVPEFSYLLAAAAISDVVLVGLNTTRRGAALARDIGIADCQVVVVSDDTAPLIDGIDCPATVINVDSPEWDSLLAPYVDAPVAIVDHSPDDLLMLIFTSGTSGDPKAVRCGQRKFAGAGLMLAERFNIGADDVVYLSMPLFHSNATIAGWSVAVAGGASIALRRSFSASGFIADLHRYRVTYANYVGKPLHYILAVPPRPDDGATSLRVVYGNEASAVDRAAFAERFGCTVVDGFGSTEGGVSITRTADTPPDALGPLPANVAVVEPDSASPVAVGTIGEIVNTTGAGLFDGYYGDVEATAERLRDGVYRTGDLGWVDVDGYVHFAGRVGDWARIDGENIGTAPVEHILVRHPKIELAAVYGVPAEIGDDLWAVLVAPNLTSDEFDEFLSGQSDLGPKQWPTRVRIVDELPQTATFKTVKRLLRHDPAPPDWVRVAGQYVPTSVAAG
ncbi:long-chain fatty-acid--CoA ligase [Gordonia effusa NBRC 100432]|uniref:Long-chain fatty-acid--CoA ligase n=1 Tax=Gordonia effusa NBRC 100432 TaxID=1077974 RepID=H0QV73_9ACTN|nr:long-chain-fatty-acid--CoA ligase [Gordonia effusa]GAB16724.1 long-chain fatty-acid--CoA ligase [Gordonia effusa NBRC 100432]